VRRVFWVALGAAAGVLVVRKLNQAAQAYTPEGIGRSLAGVADAIRDAADAVREGMAEREQELRLALSADAGPGTGHGTGQEGRSEMRSGSGRSDPTLGWPHI
jgi:hypothetical protein